MVERESRTLSTSWLSASPYLLLVKVVARVDSAESARTDARIHVSLVE